MDSFFYAEIVLQQLVTFSVKRVLINLINRRIVSSRAVGNLITSLLRSMWQNCGQKAIFHINQIKINYVKKILHPLFRSR